VEKRYNRDSFRYEKDFGKERRGGKESHETGTGGPVGKGYKKDKNGDPRLVSWSGEVPKGGGQMSG